MRRIRRHRVCTKANSHREADDGGAKNSENVNPTDEQTRRNVDETQKDMVAEKLDARTLGKVINHEDEKKNREYNPDDAGDHHQTAG